MPSLLDAIDRFNYAVSSIRSDALSRPSRLDPGPFTAAVLDLPLSDILRDADDAEYGLFSLVKESTDASVEGAAVQGKVGRRQFLGATPLRKNRGTGTNREEEPEVYLEAASKYLDRFNAIKAMPIARAQLDTLIDRLNHARDSIDSSEESLSKTTQAKTTSPEAQLAEEERRIGELKSRILELRKRKEALTAKLPTTSKSHTRSTKPVGKSQAKSKLNSPPSAVDSPSLTGNTAHPSSRPKQSTRISNSHLNTPPGSSPLSSMSDPLASPIISVGREKNISGKVVSLLDEEWDMSSMGALMSPPPSISNAGVKSMAQMTRERDPQAHMPSKHETDEDENEDEDEDAGEPTVVVSKLPREVAPVMTSPTPPSTRPNSQASTAEPQTPPQEGRDPALTPSTKVKVRRVRITAEVERVCVKIWKTVPDLLVPGNSFSSPGNRPPDAKDTLAILQAISSQPIPDPNSSAIPPSPSTRSTLSSILGVETLGPAGGSPHQIMTAQVLFSLLNAPNHNMPLPALKTLLASKAALPSPGPDAGREEKQNAAALGASAAQAGTRALYGCVAKRLVKIDRSGGEQIVKFD